MYINSSDYTCGVKCPGTRNAIGNEIKLTLNINLIHDISLFLQSILQYNIFAARNNAISLDIIMIYYLSTGIFTCQFLCLFRRRVFQTMIHIDDKSPISKNFLEILTIRDAPLNYFQTIKFWIRIWLGKVFSSCIKDENEENIVPSIQIHACLCYYATGAVMIFRFARENLIYPLVMWEALLNDLFLTMYSCIVSSCLSA